MVQCLKPNGLQFSDQGGKDGVAQGVNLGGSTKTRLLRICPATCVKAFSAPAGVLCQSGFPLEEADEHYARLKAWGFNCLRFLITWEAIEHAGPGIYDQEYLDFTTKWW